MSEPMWTPGPWAYRPVKHDDWGYVRGAPKNDGFPPFICQAKDMRKTEEDENKARRSGIDPWAANAHLIAAAPDLYAQLERAVLWAEKYKSATPWYDDAREFLEKARGDL